MAVARVLRCRLRASASDTSPCASAAVTCALPSWCTAVLVSLMPGAEASLLGSDSAGQCIHACMCHVRVCMYHGLGCPFRSAPYGCLACLSAAETTSGGVFPYALRAFVPVRAWNFWAA